MNLTNPQIEVLQNMLRNMFTHDGCGFVPLVILNQLVRKGLAENTGRFLEYKRPGSPEKRAKIPVGQITTLGVNVLGQALLDRELASVD
jgi:hypothetical protein